MADKELKTDSSETKDHDKHPILSTRMETMVDDAEIEKRINEVGDANLAEMKAKETNEETSIEIISVDQGTSEADSENKEEKKETIIDIMPDQSNMPDSLMDVNGYWTMLDDSGAERKEFYYRWKQVGDKFQGFQLDDDMNPLYPVEGFLKKRDERIRIEWVCKSPNGNVECKAYITPEGIITDGTYTTQTSGVTAKFTGKKSSQQTLLEDMKGTSGPPKLEKKTSIEDMLKMGSSFIGSIVTSPITTLAPKMAAKKSATETFLCQICYCNEPFDDNAVELDCGHRFCKGCLGGWLRTQINNGTINHSCFFRIEKQRETKVVFKPGSKLGMTLSTFGEVTMVEEGGQAEQLGVEVGYRMTNIEEIANKDFFYETISSASDPVSALEQMALGPWTAVFDTVGVDDFDDEEEECGKPISSDILQELIGEELFKKFERFKRFAENEHLRECPWPECDHEQNGDPENPIMVCEKCGREYCYNHSNAHPGETCEKFEKATYDEFKKIRQAGGWTLFGGGNQVGKVLECPGCSRNIQKTSGCNHMTCATCNTEFCWICGETITGTVYEHYTETSCYQFRHDAFPWIEVDDDDPLGIWGWFCIYLFGGLLCSGPVLVVWILGLLLFIPVFSMKLAFACWEEGLDVEDIDFQDVYDEAESAIQEFFEASLPIGCACVFGWICFGPLAAFVLLCGPVYFSWKYCCRKPKTAKWMYFEGSEINMRDDEYKITTVEGVELWGTFWSLEDAIEFIEARRQRDGNLVVNVIPPTENIDNEEEEQKPTYQIKDETGELLPTIFDSIYEVKKFLKIRSLKREQDLDEDGEAPDIIVETPQPDPGRIFVERYSWYNSPYNDGEDPGYIVPLLPPAELASQEVPGLALQQDTADFVINGFTSSEPEVEEKDPSDFDGLESEEEKRAPENV